MSTKMILVPLDRYRVDFEVGLGTPFSRLDALVLRAMSEEGASCVADLVKLLLLPSRLLIESIVSLSRAGWVAVGGLGEEFSLTPVGQLALRADVLPTPERVLSKQGSLLVERMTGQVATLRDLTFWTARRLQDAGLWDKCDRLPRNPNLAPLDAGQAKPLLSRDRNEWIRWVGEPIPQQEVWLKVAVDVSNATASGVPEVWANALLPKLADVLSLPELAVRRPKFDQEQLPAPSPLRAFRTVRSEHVRLILGGNQHRAALKSALSEAQSQVLIASAFANADVLEADIKPEILSALTRGVRVDLLWGYSAGTTLEAQERTLKVLNAIRKASGQGQLLRFNEKPSGSHGKLLLWDAPDGFKACLGSNNWLSVPNAAYDEEHHEVSVVTSDLGLAADLCTTVAGIWARAEATSSGSNDLWHRTASDMERALALQGTTNTAGAIGDLVSSLVPPASAQASIVRDQEHDSIMRNLVLSAKRRVGIASHKLGPAGQIRIESAKYGANGEQRSLKVVVGEQPEDGESVARFAEVIRNLGGDFIFSPGMHAKLLVADDSVVVSSYNFLSADPFGTAEGAREIGILMRSEQLSDAVWQWIAGREKRDA